jgi:perosamine synthetase
MIPIYEPFLEPYKQSSIDAINSEWISNHGKYILLAENELKKFSNSKYCILMNNGTSATHCLFLALKFKHPSITKIYIPNHVFVAPWNCGLREYGVEFFEILETENSTLNMKTDDDYISRLEKNSTVVIVHNLSSIINVPRLKRMRPDIIFLEDNCEGFLGKYEELPTGSVSLCSAVSFYANKNITTGEGGAFLTNDEDVYTFIKKYHSHGMSNDRYIHDALGTNYRMTNIQAALLYDQLCDIEKILKRKKEIFSIYNELLLNNEDVELIKTEKNTESSYWIFPIKLITKTFNLKRIEDFFLESEIIIRPCFYDFRKHGIYNFESKSKDINFNVILLPSYPRITYEQQKKVIITLESFLVSLKLYKNE